MREPDVLPDVRDVDFRDAAVFFDPDVLVGLRAVVFLDGLFRDGLFRDAVFRDAVFRDAVLFLAGDFFDLDVLALDLRAVDFLALVFRAPGFLDEDLAERDVRALDRFAGFRLLVFLVPDLFEVGRFRPPADAAFCLTFSDISSAFSFVFSTASSPILSATVPMTSCAVSLDSTFLPASTADRLKPVVLATTPPRFRWIGAVGIPR